MEEELKNQLESWRAIGATKWKAQRGYIPTTSYENSTGPGEWTEGIDYVVLDSDAVAYRLTGDWRDNGDWEIVSVDEFINSVDEDVEMWLSRHQERLEDV